ncbi:MAG: sugar phosphate isomerase/epimerase, partial [Proteobacteria bacterium]|nr:sugar phosphate isomerase/epimerase [Pseudomonadota bacterium]
MKKLCITCSIENCYPKALVVFRGIEDSLRQAAELGYSGVELALYRKDNIDVGEVKKLLTRYGMEIPVVSTGQMFTMLEVWFTHPEAAVRRKAVEEFKGIIDVASEFGA